jgi:hypothetical protein
MGGIISAPNFIAEIPLLRRYSSTITISHFVIVMKFQLVK